MDASSAAPRTSRIGLGGLMIVAGIMLVAWPGTTVLVLVTLFGLGVLVYGVIELLRVFAGRTSIWISPPA